MSPRMSDRRMARKGEVNFIHNIDSPFNDAFSRMRVSDPVTLFDSMLQYDLHQVFWEDVTAGSASVAHGGNAPTAVLSVTAAAGDSVKRQSKEYIRYQPGKSQLIVCTFVMGSAVSGVERRVGSFDDVNGLLLEQDGTNNVYLVKRSNVSGSNVQTKVAQSDWNVDTLDGSSSASNPSGLALDLSKVQILVFDLQWLGVGRVRAGFEIDGEFILCHEFLHSNIDTAPYMATANLPIRYEINNASGANAATLTAICSAVISEGGFDHSRGSIFCASTGTTLPSVTTRRPILSIRPKQTFNSITNRGLIIPDTWKVFVEDKESIFELMYGGDITGGTAPSWTSVNADSIVEYDVAATQISGGIPIDALYVAKAESARVESVNRFPLTLDVSGAHPSSPYSDVLSVVSTSVTTATNNGAVLRWQEIR